MQDIDLGPIEESLKRTVRMEAAHDRLVNIAREIEAAFVDKVESREEWFVQLCKVLRIIDAIEAHEKRLARFYSRER